MSIGCSYALHGSVAANRAVRLTKVYEPAPQTNGIQVDYEGVLAVSPQSNRIVLHGSWRNTSSHTNGYFLCGQQELPKAENQSCAVVFCNGIIALM